MVSKTGMWVLVVIVFLAGMVAGSGAGYAYGTSVPQTALEQRADELTKQLNEANSKNTSLVREYNKLMETSKLPPAPVKPAAAVPTVAPTSAPAAKPTVAANVPAPVADFSTDRVEAKPDQAVKFRDDTTGKVTSWLWDFGDGKTSTEQNPVHKYAENGTYTITLKVTGPGGTDTIQRKEFIRIAEDCDC